MKLELGDETGRLIRELYALTAKLEGMYPGRHFTPDGHMVGSLGEVAAAKVYGLKLFEASNPVHDAFAADGKLIQIKTTQGDRIAISDEPSYLIVLRLNRDGTFDEIYNGPGEPVWAAAGKLQKTGQRHVSLTKLAELSLGISPTDRIPKKEP